MKIEENAVISVQRMRIGVCVCPTSLNDKNSKSTKPWWQNEAFLSYYLEVLAANHACVDIEMGQRHRAQLFEVEIKNLSGKGNFHGDRTSLSHMPTEGAHAAEMTLHVIRIDCVMHFPSIP